MHLLHEIFVHLAVASGAGAYAWVAARLIFR